MILSSDLYLLTISLDLVLDFDLCLGGWRPVELLSDIGPWLWGEVRKRQRSGLDGARPGQRR